jgi:hypothetical protein
LLSELLDILPRPAGEILSVIANSPSPLSTVELGDRLGRATHGGSWNNAMALLRNNRILIQTGDGWRLGTIFGVQRQS